MNVTIEDNRGKQLTTGCRGLLASICCLVLVFGFLAGTSPSSASAACSNESLRSERSAELPDCRAYELVTPPAAANGRRFGDLKREGHSYDLYPSEVVSPSRGDVLFETKGSALLTPPGGNGRYDGDIYESARSPMGWDVVRHVTPNGVESDYPEFGGVSSDHSFIFVFAGRFERLPAGTLTQEGEADYLGDSEGHFELTGIGELGVEPLAQGRYISPAGRHVIFSTGRAMTESGWCNDAEIVPNKHVCLVKKLTSKAPLSGTGAIYDRPANGLAHVVSLLPGDVTPLAGENALYQGASADGSTIAFKIAGTLYVRIHSGDALEEETLKVAEGDPTYGGFSEDGTYLFYESGGDIHRFNTTSTADQEVNTSSDAKMVNASADGSHVYFISTSQLDGSQGTIGKPNLYVWSGSSPSPHFIATVDPEDTEGVPALTNWTSYAVAPIDEPAGLGPAGDSSRTTPDGKVLVFQSRAPITGYGNAGHSEIFRYDDEGKGLLCVSCNPSGTPAEHDAELQDLGFVSRSTIIRNVNADGRRVFFETAESLVEADDDEVNDIYEWQQESPNSPSLISSGKSVGYPEQVQGVSPKPNVLLGVTPDGGDVVFLSQDSLVPAAGVGGAQAIYDARVDGGFPETPASPICLEEACRPAPTAPPLLAGASSSGLPGRGNVRPAEGKKRKRKRHCRARHSKRRHCVKKRSASRSVASGAAGEGSNSDGASGFGFDARSTFAALAESGAGEGFPGPAKSLGGSEFSFGIESSSAAVSTTNAGQHPDFTTKVVFPAAKNEASPHAEDIAFELPPGLYGNPNIVPRCSTGDFVGGECPVDSQVGISRIQLWNFPHLSFPVFNLKPVHPKKEIARFGIMAAIFPVFIDVSVRTASDYGVTAGSYHTSSQLPLEEAETTFWGNPADPSHNPERMTIKEADKCGSPCDAGGERSTEELGPVAFMTNPSACGPWQVTAHVTNYQLPGQLFTGTAAIEPGPVSNCQGLPFEPSFEAHPTSHRAGAPTGLETVFKLPQTSDPKVPSTATMREARVTLPEGMTIDPGAADGLAACSEQQVGYHEEVNAACPDASKLGTATIASPALPRPLEGTIYLRSPRPGHQFGFWLASDDLGLHVKLPGDLEPDQKTGRLSVVFADLPQVPVEEVAIDVWGGDRAPLKNPDACGPYQTAFSFKPHSDDPAVSGQTQMTIDEGCSTRGFSPQLSGGVTDTRAGRYSPFLFDLVRGDSEQDLADLEVTLPAGELAKLRGVPLCADADAATGACPAGSHIGHLIAAAGSGPLPLWVPQPGKPEPAVYLAGPYEGTPYSIVAVVPAQAGPFDLGNVVARSALRIDPETAVATVMTKPLPQIVEGVPISYRRLHVVVDRPEFTLNPTNCRELAITSTLTSTQGALAHPSDRFQVDGCRALKFKPKLAIRLKGGTERGDYPALSATLKARHGDANLKRVSVALPHSEFLAQEHIRTICTRVQFAARKCPKGSVYGRAKAWTPLLNKPLAGQVYLRSSEHPLPDLVLDLRGQIEIAAAGRVDSKNGGIRITFDAIPDASVSKVVLQMRGGSKSLLTNSTDICHGPKKKATVGMRAQNGRRVDLRPRLEVGCGK